MPIKQCCATGSLHSGKPTGRLEKVHGLDAYIADAPNGQPKGIVVIIPDIFGIDFPNNRILADEYAKKGNFQVILPDFMNGIAVPFELMISFKALSATGFWNQIYKLGHVLYLMRHFLPFMVYNRYSIVKPRIWDFLKAVKKNEAANLPMGAAGFCWGGKYVTELCWDESKSDDGKRLIECGYVAHPSLLVYPDDIEKVVLPLSCAASEHDEQMSPEQAKQTEEILTGKTAKTKDAGVEHEFVMYHDAHHGFAVRADENDKEEAERGLKAEEQALAWLERWFTNPAPLST